MNLNGKGVSASTKRSGISGSTLEIKGENGNENGKTMFVVFAALLLAAGSLVVGKGEAAEDKVSFYANITAIEPIMEAFPKRRASKVNTPESPQPSSFPPCSLNSRPTS